MIIYQMKKPIECYDTDCVGVTGDNIAYTQYFYIKDVSDDSISYTLHLRFADGSVNSITPDIVIPDGEGTEIRWIVKKNDIFMHGYFELQIEGRNKLGLVFQTEIVRLYADESLPVEDKEYANPNSETVKLREEAYAALEEMKKQQAQIEDNVKKIEQTDLNNKADKSTTLAGYGITDGENIGNKITDKKNITDEYSNYPSISYLLEYYYDYNEVDDALSGKLDNTAGAVKNDNIANKAVTSDKIANSAITAMKLANSAVSGSNIAQNQISTNHLQSGAVTTEKLADEVKTSINGKADKAATIAGYGITDAENIGNKVSDKEDISRETNSYPSISYLRNFYYEYSEIDDLLSQKYDSSNVETGSGSLTVNTQSAIDSELVKSCEFKYQKFGEVVDIFFNIVFNAGSFSYLQFTGLPFAPDIISNQNRQISVTSKNTQTTSYLTNSWLTLKCTETTAVTQDEVLRGTLQIKLK
jgi:hypothetical protein